MLWKLQESVELYKVQIKHYHMSPTQSRRRTSMLGLPDSVYETFEDMCSKCRVCSTSIAPPPRARISGIWSTNFGDVIFVDHADIHLRKSKYMVLLVLDGATNLLWATAQNSLNNKETIQALRLWTDEHNCLPKSTVGDEAFFQEDFLTYSRTYGIKECPCGSRTPWPNRTESAVRLFKRQWQIMSRNLEDDRFRGITIREAVKRTVWARNAQLTVSGYSPLEIGTGRRPPDLLDIEISDPAQLSVGPLPEDKTQLEWQRLALRARQEARQAADLRHDMAKRTVPSEGPYKPGDKVFVWSSPVNANSITSKAWKKERWIRGSVISQEGAVVNVHVDNAVMRVNQSKVRGDHDEGHDVAVPGLDTSEPVPLAVEDEVDYEPDIAEYAEAYLGEQAHWFCQTGKCDVVELFSSNTGLSWHMARLNMKVGEPIDHKHGWSFNSKKKQNQVWKQLVNLDPEYVLITNPSPNSWKYSVFKFCLDVMQWQVDRGKGFLVIAPPDSGFAQFLGLEETSEGQNQVSHRLLQPWHDKLLSVWSFNQELACVVQSWWRPWHVGTTACLQERGEALEWSTVEGLTIAFVLIHCAIHTTCTFEGHETVFPVWRSVGTFWWWSIVWHVNVSGPWCWVFMFVARLASCWDLYSSVIEAHTATEVYQSVTCSNIENCWSVAKEYRG